MGDKRIENTNLVSMRGKIEKEFRFSHDSHGENFYTTDLVIHRRSDAEDRIPLVVSDRVMDVRQSYAGSYVSVHGLFQSRNYRDEEKVRTALSVLARDFSVVDDEERGPQDHIYLEGFLCKKPVFRKTPGGREISELILAVNRSTGRTDYIPCISWGKTARFASGLPVGCHLMVWGRIQSREYSKKTEEEVKLRVTYEVSVARLELY
ncbi:MAG: single-stranded DNA-binding protein [Eubacteriales bacterium]|nr:single-stranded DNA-binding protein [Eubacteriales bacterium]